MGSRPAPCLLLSGGIDSALVARLIVDGGRTPSALFIDYGQPAAHSEAQASEAVAESMRLPYAQLSVGPLKIPVGGEIPGRNDLLIGIARVAAPNRDIAIGIHSGTSYRDCSRDYREAWQAALDVQHAGSVQVITPLIDLAKPAIIRLASISGVPFELTYSCETGNSVCEQCSSCLDRIQFLESA